MRGGMGNSIITTILASVGGGLITWVATRVFIKSEDSASKTYVDAEIDKIDAKLSKKVDKDDYNIAIQRVEGKLDKVLMLLIEQKQSPQGK